MTLSNTTKDILKMVLPLSCFIIFFYWIFVARANQNEYASLNEKYLQIKKRVQASGGENSKEIKELTAELSQYQKMWRELFPTSHKQSHAINRVQDVISKNNMILLEEGPVDIKVSNLSRQFKGLVQQSLKTRRTEGEIWKVTLRGPYLSMLNVLKGMSHFSEFAVPIWIEMETSQSAESTQHSWNVYLWI